MSEHDDLCKAMSQNGWLSHPLACLNRVYGPGQSLVTALRSTSTYKAFVAGQKPPPFNESEAIPAVLTYTRRRGRRGQKYEQPDRVLIDRSAGLLMHIHSENGHRTIAFLDDVDPASISEVDNIAESRQSLSRAPDDVTRLTEAERIPTAIDMVAPPGRIQIEVSRIIRDTTTARAVKALHSYQCQICGECVALPNGGSYGEAHHIRPLGAPHHGADCASNILCLCPNHHASLDFGAIAIHPAMLRLRSDHLVSEESIDYHNRIIYGRQKANRAMELTSIEPP